MPRESGMLRAKKAAGESGRTACHHHAPIHFFLSHSLSSRSRLRSSRLLFLLATFTRVSRLFPPIGVPSLSVPLSCLFPRARENRRGECAKCQWFDATWGTRLDGETKRTPREFERADARRAAVVRHASRSLVLESSFGEGISFDRSERTRPSHFTRE